MGLEHSRHRFPINTCAGPLSVPILACLAACSLAQTKGNIDIVHMVWKIPSLSSPYPEPEGIPGLILVAEVPGCSSFPKPIHSQFNPSGTREGFPAFPWPKPRGAQPIQPWAIVSSSNRHS